MRKIISILIAATLAGSLAVGPAAAKSKSTAKAKGPSLEALTERVIGYSKENDKQFSRKEPDIEAILSYVSPKLRKTYRASFQKEVDDPSRYVETRSTPVEIRRIISAKQKSAKTALVEYCDVVSLNALPPSEIVELDNKKYPLIGSRKTFEWTAIGNVWFLVKQTTVADLTQESECLSAK
jgi:Ni/Co efflux regulator RcnB